MKKVLVFCCIIIAIVLIVLSIVIVAQNSKKREIDYISDSYYLYDIAVEYLKDEVREEIKKNYNHEYPVFCDYNKIAITKENNKNYAYMWILTKAYKSKSITLMGSSAPYKFIFENDKVVSYEMPQDGERYSKSIKDMFPDDIENKVDEFRVSGENLEQEVEKFFASMQQIESFEFSFETSSKKDIRIIDERDSEYSVINFGGESKIVINDNKYDLEEALNSGYIDVKTILDKLKNDDDNSRCLADSFMDGGSREYNYENMTVIVTNRLFEEKHEIIFGPSNKEIDGVFNAYLKIKENQYTGSDYTDGMGISMYLSQIVNDNLWIVKDQERTTMNYLIKIDKNIEIASDIKEGDKINLVFSGQYEDGYWFMEARRFGEDSSAIELTIFNDETEADKNGARTVIDEILGERCWLVHDIENSDSIEMFIIGDKEYKLNGDSIQVGSRFKAGSVIGASSKYLKDVTKIEKAK